MNIIVSSSIVNSATTTSIIIVNPINTYLLIQKLNTTFKEETQVRNPNICWKNEC